MEIIVAIFIGIVGILGHWYTRYIQNRTKLSFLDYMRDSFPYTLASILSVVASVTTIVATGGLNATTVALCYTAGYTLDSMFNKDSTVQTNDTRNNK